MKTFIISILITALTPSLFSQNERINCINSGGEWTIPVYDLLEGETKKESFCDCPQGFILVGEFCEEIARETLCESSGGTWSNQGCICPEGSFWNDRIGICDYTLSISDDGLIKRSSSILLVFIALIILGVFIHSKRKGRK